MSITIIVEDGSTVPNANSYVSLEDAFNYHLTMGNSAFTNGAADYATFIAGNTDVQARSLIQATMQIDLLYASLYIGYPSSSTQSLLWPRIPTVYGTPYTYDYVGFQSYIGLRDAYGLYRSSNVIPIELKKAVFQAALQIFGGDTLIPTALDNQAQVAETLNQVGDIKVMQRFFKPVSTAKTNLLNQILYPIIVSGNRLIRG